MIPGDMRVIDKNIIGRISTDIDDFLIKWNDLCPGDDQDGILWDFLHAHIIIRDPFTISPPSDWPFE